MAYKGQSIFIPLGEIGLLTDVPQPNLPPNALVRAKNVCFSKGAVEKAPGTIKYNSSALSAKIVAAHDWWPDINKQRFICATSDGKLSLGRDRAFSTLNSGLPALTPNCVFVEGGVESAGNPKKLFFFTGGASNPYVLEGDGSSFSVIGSPNTDWTVGNYPKFGLIHRSRLWAFAGQFGYASATSNHSNFTSGDLSDAIYPGEGGELRAAAVYKGRLLAFKDGGFVYILNDQDTDTANWYWQRLAANFGVSAPNAVTEALDDLIAGNTTGTLTSYSATEKLGNIEAADLLQLARIEAFHRANVSTSGLLQQHVLYYPEKKQLFATYRSGYSPNNDTLLVYDVSGSGQARIAYWQKGTPSCLALYKDTNEIYRPMYGDASGFLNLCDREDRTEAGGTAYTGEFQTPHLDFSFAAPDAGSKLKHFDWIGLHHIPEGSGDLSCDYFVDGRYVETITFELTENDSEELDTFLLDTNRLSQNNSETCVRRLKATGRTISFKFYNSGSNQSFQVTGFTVGFRFGGKGATKN